MSIINKKQKEKETAVFFCKWFNNSHNRNFVAYEDPLDQDSDWILKEAKNQVKLQITTCDHILIRGILDSIKTPGEVGPVFDPKHQDCMIKAIQDKCKYSKQVQKNLILLIYSDLAKFNPEYLQREIKKNCMENHFKEIYLVELPKLDSLISYPLYNGNIIKLK